MRRLKRSLISTAVLITLLGVLGAQIYYQPKDAEPLNAPPERIEIRCINPTGGSQRNNNQESTSLREGTTLIQYSICKEV